MFDWIDCWSQETGEVAQGLTLKTKCHHLHPYYGKLLSLSKKIDQFLGKK